MQPGEYQYKFRLGPDDGAWTLDDKSPKTMDGEHENNSRVVTDPSLQRSGPGPVLAKEATISAQTVMNGASEQTRADRRILTEQQQLLEQEEAAEQYARDFRGAQMLVYIVLAVIAVVVGLLAFLISLFLGK